jgi:hypothetical protein
MSSHESGGYWRYCRWPSGGRTTWSGTGTDYWWLWHILEIYHVIFSAYESDEYRSECRYFWYSIWASLCVIVSYPQLLHPSSWDLAWWSQKARTTSLSTRPKDTYNPSLFKGMFDRRRWCSLFYYLISETDVYFVVLHFILFILN